MKRVKVPPRDGWVQRLLDVGFDYWDLPSSDGTHYWQEGVAYEFTLKQIDVIEDSTNELHSMCMAAVADIVKSGDYHPAFGFSDATKALIEQSWKRGDPHLFGRFDLSYDGSTIKMLEYNADTPTSLLEASVVQWDWVIEAQLPNHDQFNSIHEKLIERFKMLRQSHGVRNLHMVAAFEAGREDWGNLEYLQETAVEAGINCFQMPIDALMLKDDFVDPNDRAVEHCFKLYPWEWMANEEFGADLTSSRTRWLEPPWKMLLSNKAILPILWKRQVGHPLLLEARFIEPSFGKWIRKPTLGREGANVELIENEVKSKLSGSDFVEEYDKTGYIYQQWVDLPMFSGFRPLLGSWVVGDVACGMGIREDFNVITGNDSHFIPHYFFED